MNVTSFEMVKLKVRKLGDGDLEKMISVGSQSGAFPMVRCSG